MVAGMFALSVLAMPAPAAASGTAAESAPGEMRVATVAYRLAIANRAHCDAFLEPQPGFLIQHEAGQTMTVTAVFSGSPAEEAGLQVGDRLSAVNDQDLADASHLHQHQLLHTAIQDGPVNLRVTGREGEVQFAPENGCRMNVTLVEDEGVNAWADGTGIRLTTGLLTRCKSDDDLALVLGHELAHNLLRHSERIAGRSALSGLLPAGGAAWQELHDSEEEADRVAVSLAMAARYDLTGAEAFMDSLLDRSIVDSQTHPGADRRLALLREAIAQAR